MGFVTQLKMTEVILNCAIKLRKWETKLEGYPVVSFLSFLSARLRAAIRLRLPFTEGFS